MKKLYHEEGETASEKASWPRPADEPAEKRALVALSLVPGVGPGRMRALLARCGSAAAVMNASRRSLEGAPGVGGKTAQAIRQFDGEDLVDEQLRRAERAGATLVAAWDERFPRRLRRIYDPPGLLWMRGTLQPEDRRAIAIVGTRRCTDYGRQQARRFAGALARKGFTIVSGLAYGVDAAAHGGALEAGGRTLAVFGTGVDRIYPSKNKSLARRIAEGDGALLSEFPLGTGPEAQNFPSRNRIISGLSLGTLVVESHESGGALITARMAVEQNREVFAIPSSLRNKAGVGTNHLIQRGHAKLVTGPEDILEELNVPAPSEEREKVGADTDEASATDAMENLDESSKALLEVIGPEPVHIDVLCDRTGLDASTALVYLLELEFEGLIRQMAGKQFYRA